MKAKTRFIKSVIETAKKNDAEMPWQRGARRAGFVAIRRVRDADQRNLNTA